MHNFVHCRDAVALDYTDAQRTVSYTFRQLSHQVYTVSNYLFTNGLEPEDHVAIWMPNLPETVWVDLGATLAGAIITPIAPQAATNDVVWLLNDLAAKYIFVATKKQLEALQGVRTQLPNLKKVIVLEEIELEDEWMVPFYWMMNFPTQIVSLGNVHTLRETKNQNSTLNILYPIAENGKLQRRGVVLSHGNCLATIRAIGERLGFQTESTVPTRYVSTLSIAHVQERMMGYYTLLYYAKTIVINEVASSQSLSAQIAVTRANFTCVPSAQLELLREQMSANMMDSTLSRWALANGLRVAQLQLSGNSITWFLRKKHAFYRRQREAMRKKYTKPLSFIVSYGAPLQETTDTFFYALGCTILQSFGVTETFGFATIDDLADPRPLTAGKALDGLEVQMERYGAIIVRGESLFKTYWKQVRPTADAFDKDGFFRTPVKGHLENLHLVIMPTIAESIAPPTALPEAAV